MVQQTCLMLQTQQDISVQLSDLSSALAAQITAKLAHIASPKTTAIDGICDIVLQTQQHTFPALAPHAQQMNAIYACYVQNIQGIANLFLFNKGHVCCQVCFAHPITVQFDPKRLSLSRLYNLIIFCIRYLLQQSQHFLIHGGVYIKQQRPLLLLGQRGSKKTLIGLSLLKLGWDYLCEDKFIVKDQTITCYDSHFILNDHHFELLPWLIQQYPAAKKFRQGACMRHWVRSIAKTLLPAHLLPGSDRLLNKGLSCVMQDIFPGSHQIKMTRSPVSVLLLCHQAGINQGKISPLSRQQMISQLVLLQQLAFSQYNQTMALIRLCQQVPTISLANQLHCHFPAGKFAKLAFDHSHDLDPLVKMINQWH